MKNQKTGYVILIIVGIAFMIAGAVIGLLNKNIIWAVQCAGPGVLMTLIGIIMLIKVNKKKPEQEEKPAPAVAEEPPASTLDSSERELMLPPVPENGYVLRAESGVDLFDYLPACEELQEIGFINPEGNKVRFELVWYKKYKNASYCYLGFDDYGDLDEDGEPNYARSFGRVIRFEDGSTGVYEEEDSDILDILVDDFNAFAEKRRRLDGKPVTMRVSGDKLRMPAFITLTSLSLLVLVAGLIGFFTGFGITDPLSLDICKASCLTYLLALPSYLVYFGSHNPFRLPKGAAKAFSIIGMVLMVACALVGVMSLQYYGNSAEGFWGFFFNIFLYANLVITVIICGLAYFWICKSAPSWLYLVLGILTTLFSPVFSALVVAACAVLFLIQAVMFILKSLGIMAADTRLGRGVISGWTGKRFTEEYTIIDEYGYTHTVHSDDGIDFYESDGSYAGRSDDGGRTLTRK